MARGRGAATNTGTAFMRSPENRKHERDSLFLMADLRFHADGAPFRVKLRNISDSGLLAEGAMRAVRGQKVTIALANVGAVEGTVAWAAGDRCGIAFDATIDASQVRFPVAEVDLPDAPAPPTPAAGSKVRVPRD